MTGNAKAIGAEVADIYKALQGGSFRFNVKGSQKFVRAIGSKPAFTEAMEAMTNPSVNGGVRITEEGKTVLDVLIKDGKEVCMSAKAEMEVPAGKEEGFFETLAKLFAKKETVTVKPKKVKKAKKVAVRPIEAKPLSGEVKTAPDKILSLDYLTNKELNKLSPETLAELGAIKGKTMAADEVAKLSLTGDEVNELSVRAMGELGLIKGKKPTLTEAAELGLIKGYKPTEKELAKFQAK